MIAIACDHAALEMKQTIMKLMEEKILTDGIVLPGNILKVGGFLNQQVDVEFMTEVCKEIARLFKDSGAKVFGRGNCFGN